MKNQKQLLLNLENNKLLAEFMEAEKVDKRQKINPEYRFPTKYGHEIVEYAYRSNDAYLERTNTWFADEMRFHSSWDWLKPVIDKLWEEIYEIIVNAVKWLKSD